MEIKPIVVPENWTLLRIQGRLHHEVVTHISVDDGKTLLCKRSTACMEWDDAPWLNSYGLTVHYYGRTLVMHKLCRTCLKMATK